jgi:septal ring factor EnvC (AmiA/AmiB activator)
MLLLRLLAIAAGVATLSSISSQAQDVPDPGPGGCAALCGGDSGADSGYQRHSRPPINTYNPSAPPAPMSPEEAEAVKRLFAGGDNSRAVKRMNEGDYAGALRLLARAARMDPTNSDIAGNLAQTEAELAFEREDYREAIDRIREAISYGRDDLYNRLNDFERTERQAEAVKEAEQRRLQAELEAEQRRLQAEREAEERRLAAERAAQEAARRARYQAAIETAFASFAAERAVATPNFELTNPAPVAANLGNALVSLTVANV